MGENQGGVSNAEKAGEMRQSQVCFIFHKTVLLDAEGVGETPAALGRGPVSRAVFAGWGCHGA